MKLLFAYIGLFIICFSYSQDEEPDYFEEDFLRYDNFIYKDSINSVQVYRVGWPLSYPIIQLSSEDKLHVSFDDIGTEIKDYSYTIIHCDAEWQPSDLMPQEYLTGFLESQDIDYKYSFNTLVDYTHYSFTFPNEDFEPKISGNYIVLVYEDFDKENIVFSWRFSIMENRVSIDGKIKQPADFNHRYTHHEVDFNIEHSGLRINDPYGEIKVVVSQNYRFDNAITNLKPLFIKENLLEYDYEEGNVFIAGNEFRNFDAKSTRYQSEFISEVTLLGKYYHVKLKDDLTKAFTEYYTEYDINGKEYIHKQEGEESDVEADYIYVYFNLPYDAPFTDGNLYVLGDISDWRFTEKNRMIYNFEEKAYQLKLLVKQGYYNYQYAFLKDGENGGDVSLIEGSHYETENDYIIFVYFKDPRARYDRLVGLKIFNSVRQGGVEIESPFKNNNFKIDNLFRN